MEPSLGSVLRMIQKPPHGGDTLFADMHAAYEGLSEEVKHKLDGAIAVHDFANFRERLIKEGKSEEEIKSFNEKYLCQSILLLEPTLIPRKRLFM